MQSSAICNGEQRRGGGLQDGCDFALIVRVHVCVCVCIHKGWKVLVEFLEAMQILQAQQGLLCTNVCV